jgi:DNA-binding SARP family transcriptional activator
LNAQKEEAPVEFRVLRPLEVRAGDGVLSLGAPKQRAVLGVLLLRRNEPVRTDTLVDEVWGDRPLASVSKILQGHVWRLRRALGAAVIETQPLGYLLRVDKGTLDVDRFEDLLERGRTLLADGAAAEAAAALREALRLWRGPPLADFSYEAFAATARPAREQVDAAVLPARRAGRLWLQEAGTGVHHRFIAFG